MTNKKQISTNDLTAGSVMVVDGVVVFSRVASLLQGDELKEQIKKASAFGVIIPDKPHTSISLKDCSVPKYLNDEIAVKFLEERMYTSKAKDGSIRNNCMTFHNKGVYLPSILILDKDNPDSVIDVTDDLQGRELAPDIKVRVYLNVFATNQVNNGVGLSTVELQSDKLELYAQPGSATAILNKFGKTVIKREQAPKIDIVESPNGDNLSADFSDDTPFGDVDDTFENSEMDLNNIDFNTLSDDEVLTVLKSMSTGDKSDFMSKIPSAVQTRLINLMM